MLGTGSNLGRLFALSGETGASDLLAWDYFRLCLAYCGLMLLISLALAGPVGISADFLLLVYRVTAQFGFWLVMMLLLVQALFRPDRLNGQALGAALFAIGGQALFYAGFHATKLLVPVPAGFWADAALARLDAWLHGGSAFALYDRLAGGLFPDAWIDFYYAPLWLCLAFVFPILLIIHDDDVRRRLHYLRLNLLVWVVLGNVLAILFASAGPVFHARTGDAAQFADVTAFLHSQRAVMPDIIHIQDHLWEQHRQGMLGTGISAFPSLHVAAAIVPVVYALERWRWRALPLLLHPLIVQYCSVRTGYHYALDGYASLLGVIALHALLRRLPR